MKSKMSKHFSTSLLFSNNVTDLSFGRYFFKLLQELYPELMPKKYGNTEPLKNSFDDDIEKMLSICWQNQFIWKPKIKDTLAFWSFSSLFGKQRLHSSLFLSGNPDKFRLTDIKLFYRELVSHNPADIGHIHILAEPEFNHNKRYYNEMVWALNIGFTTLELKKFLPNLAWGMFFGKPYIEMIGLEKLLKTPAYLVEQWHGGIYIQVTKDINDTYQEYDEFDRMRTRIKEYLGLHYFFSPDLSKSDYRVPTFNFSLYGEQ